MTAIRSILSSVALFLLASSARISVRSQIDTSSGSVSTIGPEGEPWQKGTKYACMQKWQVSGMLSSEAKFVDSFCLANLDKAKSMASAHLEFAEDMVKCESSKESHKMKLCALKGDAPEGRVSYSTKTHVPKSCFRVSHFVAAYPVIEAADDEEICEAAMKLPVEQQMFLPKLRTTTTITTTTTTTTSTTEDETAEDDASETVVEPEIIEAKNLFTLGDEFLWQFKDKALKCCTSTAGKPTQVQDMNAEELPAARSFGTKTGCGYMFGDTYHNGMKGYQGAGASCPVPAALLMGITGDDYDAIKSALEESD